MALDKNRLQNAIIEGMRDNGFRVVAEDFDSVEEYEKMHVGDTGKSGGKLLAGIIASAVVDEVVTNANVSTTVAAGIAVTVDPNTGVGATTGTGSGTGGVS